MNIKFTNYAKSTLLVGISAIDVSLTVASGDGAKFPVLTAGQYFYATLIIVASNTKEIVKVTARAGDVFTIVRGQDDTTGQIFATGDLVQLRLNAAALQLFTGLESNIFTGFQDWARETVVATATTTPLWVAVNTQDWTDTPTITNFPAANQAGAFRTVYPAAGTVITNNANIAVQGAANYTVAAGDRLDIEALTTTTFKVFISKKDGTAVVAAAVTSKQIQPITASVGSNALTATINPTTLDFRSTTLGDGAVTTVTLASAASVVIPNTATMGTVNAVASRLVLLAINNAGTIEAAIVNIAGGNNLDETTLITTTTIGTGADSNNVIYSTTGRTNVAFRVVGYIESTQATAGTWATAPSTVQGAGGNAVTSLGSLGYGQTWQDVTGSRALATTYYNTTGRPIMVSPSISAGAAARTVTMTINGVAIRLPDAATSSLSSGCLVVPPGGSYALTVSGGTLAAWAELR